MMLTRNGGSRAQQSTLIDQLIASRKDKWSGVTVFDCIVTLEMDVTEPKLVWVDGRCYRFFESDVWSAKEHAAYTEDSNPEEFHDLNDDACPIDIDIVSIDGGRYKHSFYVPQTFFRFIIGAGGMMRKKLENETKTTINVPKVRDKGSDIAITGNSKTSVISARHRIDLLVENSKKKLKFTHFLSIPMIDKNITEKYEEFKDLVLKETGKDSRGVHERIFQKPEKMHLTLGLMVLVDDNEIKAAVDALEEFRETIMPIVRKHSPIIITIKGLECFNDDPSDTSVIYGKVSTPDNVLQELTEKIVDFFVEKGLMKRQWDNINLHLTVMNTSFAIAKEQTRWQPVEKFDATNILKAHKEYFFGETMLNTIQLCERGAKAEDGYYKIKSKITLND